MATSVPPGVPTRLCPKCAMVVPAKARICPYCHKRIRTSRTTWGCFGLILALLVLWLVSPSPHMDRSPSPSPQKSVASVAAPSAASGKQMVSSGSVKVEWIEKYAATVEREAINRKTTVTVPLAADSKECAQRFSITQLSMRYDTHGKATIALSPELTIRVKKLFEGRGTEPQLRLVFSDDSPPQTIELREIIDIDAWPRKGYTWGGTVTYSVFKGCPPEPKNWRRVDLLCED